MTDNYTKIEGELEKEEEKTCTKCNEVKPFSEFHKQSSHRTGRAAACKICTKLKVGHIPRKKMLVDPDKDQKECTQCRKILSFSSFYKDSTLKGGLSPCCKECKALSRGCTPRKVMFLDMGKELKQCRTCERILPFSKFCRQGAGIAGISTYCKECVTKDRNDNIEKHREISRKSKAKNYARDREKINARKRRNRSTLTLERERRYYDKNRDKINARIRKRRIEDPNFKIKKNLTSRGANAVRYGIKAGSFVSDLGCSLDYFHEHLEAQFYDRADSTCTPMTWENQGFYGWHMDHIKPLSSFDLTDREQFIVAAHYTNYQPLWSEDNLSKGDREDWSRW